MDNKLPGVSQIPLGNPNNPANKVYITIFAGRKRYLSCLKRYLDILLERNIITEIHLWDYVRDYADSLYIQELSRNPKYVYMRPTKNYVNWNEYYEFYSNAAYDAEDIIVKCDDDVVYLDVDQMACYLNEIKQGGIYYPNIINNDVCAYIQYKYGIHKLISDSDIYEKYGTDRVPLTRWNTGWYTRFDRAEAIHREFLANPRNFRINASTFPWKGRISINMFGSRFASIREYYALFMKHGESDDEGYFSHIISKDTSVRNYIVPFMNIVHFSFGPQNPCKLDVLFLNSYQKLIR